MKKIKLTQGKFALIDNADFELVSKYKWYCQRHSQSDKLFYAQSCNKSKTLRMHRLITNALPKQEVDHINGNGLDNRRKNLRACTHKQNIANMRPGRRNKSGFRGVIQYKDHKGWAARIGRSGIPGYHLGFFKTKKLAAIAYNKEAKKRYGNFAYKNKI
jgi:hypothetical protein